jgi:hypothetical protein
MVFMRESMQKIKESYGRIGDKEDCFDIDFWQQQGEQAIFNAAYEMILDYLILRHGNADKPGLQRTVEHFGKLDWIKSKESGGRPQDLLDAEELRKSE